MENGLSNISSAEVREIAISSSLPLSLAWPETLRGETTGLMLRMFRDPRVLEPQERRDLIAQLQAAVDLEPNIPEIRVLFGMALCVDLQAQESLEQLREAARQAPNCFIARLKFGELLMRLRICGQAAEETQEAAQLATNGYQADLARKQAAQIRTMLREGIERGGYRGLFSRFIPSRESLTPRSRGWFFYRRNANRSESTPMPAESR
jgi:hypothetical protein